MPQNLTINTSVGKLCLCILFSLSISSPRSRQMNHMRSKPGPASLAKDLRSWTKSVTIGPVEKKIPV